MEGVADGLPFVGEQAYSLQIRDVLEQVPEGGWKEFSAFAGPRLQKLTGWDKCVLLGDASHPLSGECCRKLDQLLSVPS